MFDIGWSEMAVIALLTLLVIGPKELPRVLRTVGQWVRKAQSLAREFQRGLDDMAREADLEDAKKLVDAGRSIANPKKMVMDSIDPTGSVAGEAQDLHSAMTAAPAAESAAPTTTAKPAGNGAPAQPKSASSQAKPKPVAKPKAKSPAKSQAKSAPKAKSATAGSNGSGSSQKTA